jgi:hypothetical protein
MTQIPNSKQRISSKVSNRYCSNAGNVLVIWYSDFEIVSDFDIRISNLFSATKNTNFTTNGNHPLASRVVLILPVR